MKLAINITQQPNGSYRAFCPSLPGCSVCGQTKEDAYSRIDLAVQGYLASLDVCLPRELSRAMATATTSSNPVVFRSALQVAGHAPNPVSRA